MGTNFYMFTKNIKLAHEYFAKKECWGFSEKEYELVDDPELGYWIHLNKCSCGWKPLFQVHKAFRTFLELEMFYKRHEKKLKIYDEYGELYTWEEYKQRIVAHANRQPEPMKWVYDEEKMFNDNIKTLHTETCLPEEAELWIPFDHLLYAKTEREAAQRFKCFDYGRYDHCGFYSHNDAEYPVDWVNGDFS